MKHETESASHDVAKALKIWLPNLFQPLATEDVFLSSQDIAKGASWFNALGKVLDACDFGILCLTQANMSAPWILYEAGAVAKRLDQANVVPLLIGISTKDLTSPLSHLNAAGASKDEIRKLVDTINQRLGQRSLDQKKFDVAFKLNWPRLKKDLDKAIVKTKPACES